MSQCCLSGFKWDGKPEGNVGKLGNNNAYITGSNKEVAILMIHDIFGWTFPNLRLLADHYAKEADATVYLPDFFDGEVVPVETMTDPAKMAGFSFPDWKARHSKDIRYPEILACTQALRQEHGFKKIGAIGFCWGGWGVFKLGAKGENLVDCISTAHPSFLTKEEMDAVGVPVQIMAPEHDPLFTPDLKAHANTVIPTLDVEYDYQYFPGVSHGFSVKGDQDDARQKKALVRAKNAAVGWFAQHLHQD